MNIKIRDEDLGECSVDVYVDIDKDTKHLIKSLCILQILCLNSAENKEKHKEFVKLLKDTATKADQIFNERSDEVNVSATESFD